MKNRIKLTYINRHSVYALLPAYNPYAQIYFNEIKTTVCILVLLYARHMFVYVFHAVIDQFIIHVYIWIGLMSRGVGIAAGGVLQ